MSNITVHAILTVLRLVAHLFMKSIRLLYSVCDLCDDGCLNASVARPDWMITVQSVLSSLETLSGHLSQVQDEVFQDVK